MFDSLLHQQVSNVDAKVKSKPEITGPPSSGDDGIIQPFQKVVCAARALALLKPAMLLCSLRRGVQL